MTDEQAMLMSFWVGVFTYKVGCWIVKRYLPNYWVLNGTFFFTLGMFGLLNYV